MTQASDRKANQRTEDIQRAAEAARELYACGGIDPDYHNDIEILVYSFFSNDLQRAVLKIINSKNNSAIRPVIDYLRYTPFQSFRRDKNGYLEHERPDTNVVMEMINFLVLMSAREAIPVLEQLSNLERTIAVFHFNDASTCDNSSEREKAREAIIKLSQAPVLP